jgi:hypothetical protein
MKTEKLKPILSYFTPPFRYDYEEGIVFDSKNRHILDILGWGGLSKEYGNKLAAEIQDGMGELIVEFLNKEYNEHKAALMNEYGITEQDIIDNLPMDINDAQQQ